MKSRKVLVLILLLVLLVLNYFIVIRNDVFQNRDQLKAAGLCTLQPVRRETRTESHTSNGKTYRSTVSVIVFETIVEGEAREIKMDEKNVYGTNTLQPVKNMSRFEPIERYVFYTEDDLFCSKKISSVDEYIKSEIGFQVKLVVAIAIVMFFPFIILFFTDHSVKRFIKKYEFLGAPRAVCYYSNYFYGFLSVFCITFGLFMGYGAYTIRESGSEGLYVLGTFAVFLTLLGVPFLLHMMNKALLLWDVMLCYRSAFGKINEISISEIVSYKRSVSAKRDSLTIRTEKKSITFDNNCENYDQLCLFLYNQLPQKAQ